MHQDVAHNRITEIDAMCGYICQKGNQLGINTLTINLYSMLSDIKKARFNSRLLLITINLTGDKL
ncbi:ketopantoate reductase family protein [Pseudoalteromonas sp. B160]|uniref:ketopantoate reductase family protein n=1 Tax=Pseudoalteromonas sp. B160 TaxID=630414 RepID=UPI00301C88C1